MVKRHTSSTMVAEVDLPWYEMVIERPQYPPEPYCYPNSKSVTGPTLFEQGSRKMPITYIGVQSNDLTTVIEAHEFRWRYSRKPTTHVFIVRVRLATSSGSTIKTRSSVNSSLGFQDGKDVLHSPADFVEGHALISERLPLAHTVVDGFGEARGHGEESRRSCEEESREMHCCET